jgi:integrase
MTEFDPRLLETAFVPAGAPSLADCIARIEQNAQISPTRRRDLASALRRLARAIDRPAAETPADPTWLRPRIARIAPAAIGVSPKTWSNVLSDAHAALDLCDVVERRFANITGLNDDWRPLWDAVIASGDQSLAPALGRFVRFLDRLGIAPEDVADVHADAYEAALRLNELRKSPEETRRQAVYGWNLATRRIRTWPQQRLTLPNRSNRYALDPSAFPLAFQKDLDALVARMTAPDPLDPDALAAPLRPDTIRHRRAQVLRVASALVHAGMPADDITRLSILVEPGNAERALRWMLRRNGGKTSLGIAETAYMLATLGRHHVRLPDADLSRLKTLVTRLAPPRQPGLTDKNRARLRQFDDTERLRSLLQLPDRLMALGKGAPYSYKALLRSEIAVAIAILMVCPIRRKNIAELHLERSLARQRDGRVFLIFPSPEVKNRRLIEFELPARVVAMIDAHVRRRSPLLCPAGTPWLFPRRDGQAPMERSGFSTRVSKTIRRETGAEMNVHLFRHLAAKIWLDRHPGNYEALRRLLGHAELSSVLDAYAGFEAGPATRLYADMISGLGGHA